MALLELPVPKDNESFRLRTELEGETFEIDFSWNSRSAQFQMTMFDAAGTMLISTPCVGNSNLIERFKREDLPPGQLFIFDSTGQSREPTLAAFGEEFLVYYQEFVS